MKNNYSPFSYLLLLFITAMPFVSFAQGPGSLFVDAGPDVVVDCNNSCTDLTATFLETFDTADNTYTVTSIPFAPPFPFNGLANPLNPDIDDAWSPVDNLPFDFCFFGNTETEFQVGSNGVVRFDVDPGDTGGGSNAWSFDMDIPTNMQDAIGEANILLPVHDMDPTESNSEEIGYEVIGTYPNRVLVVSYYEVPMFSFSCNNLLATQMAVFYEFSNVVEMYVLNKPSCPTWNDGNAAMGIQNHAGTIGYVPPGRNTSDSPWTAVNEAWQFAPSGAQTYSFEWLDAAGNVISTNPTITVCPSGTEVYTARVTYTNTCNGDVVVLEDDVEVSLQANFSVDLGPDIETCNGGSYVLDADTGIPTVTYEWFLDGVLIPGATNPTYTVNAPNSGTYTVEATENGCTVTDSVVVNFYEQPVIANPPLDLTICDDGTTPPIFDLTENDDDVRGAQNPLFNITYHNSENDAINDVNEIVPANAYLLVGPSETIWVRIEDQSGNCFAVDSFEISYSSATATAPPSPHEICDTNSDGTETIDLNTTFDAVILGAQNPADFTVTYHDNPADAVAGINALPQPYTFTGSVFIFARVENNTSASCFATTQFNLVLVPQPIANPPVDLYQCDDGTTAGVFNLTDNDANILGGQDPTQFTVKYYQTYQDSFDDTNEIVGGVHIIVPPSPQTIYARIEDNSGSCFDLTDFEIYFSRAIAGVVPASVNYCDDDGDGGEFIDLATEFNALVLDGEPTSDYNITYHSSQADADAGVGALPNPYFVAAPGETVFIRLENRNDPRCFDSSRNIDLIIDTAAAVNQTPPNLIECDVNNDGFAAFDLTQQDAVITMGDPTLTVTYHGTLLDAQTGALPLPNPYTNDQRYLDAPITDPTDPNYGTGGVWARVMSNTNSCEVVVPFALEVRSSPVGTVPAEPLRLCDDATADGFTFFDLTVVAPEVLGSLDPNGFDLYYYEIENDAIIAGDNAMNAPDFSQAIPDPTNFLNSTNPQEIYILIVGNGTGTIPPNPNISEGCYDIVPLTLIVDPRPADLGPFEMGLCDDDLQGSTLDDEISTFDLTSQDVLVSGGDPSITVTWFLNAADEAADNPIPNPTTFQNTATPQTVIGRVTSEFGCNTLVTLTLTVFPNPNPNTTPDPLELCDDDDDGIVGGWDLTLADANITGGEPDVTVTYYELEADAIAGVAGTEITMPYTNTTPFSQIVYARVEKDVPPASIGCFTVVELELQVIALPDVPVSPDFSDPFIGCDETGSGTAVFDLTLQDAGVLGVQDPADFLPIRYYEVEADANAGNNNFIANPTSYISAGGQTIWVRLESRITGCARVTPFTLELELFPTIGTGDDLTKCDDLINGSTSTDGLSTFDLTVNTPLITLGDPNLTLYYYANAADQTNNIPIANPAAYQNVISPQQEIFVTVYSQNECRAFTSFFITVEPLPVAITPDPFVACDANNDGFAQFDLSTQTPIITGGDPNLSVTYHGTLTEAENNGIQLPNLYTNDQIYLDVPITDPNDPAYGTGGVWARVTTTANACHSIVAFTLEVHSSPVATEPEPLRKCDDSVADGFTEFDLTVKAAEILGGLDPNQFDLYYYENLADAQLAGDLALTAPDYSAAIPNAAAYTNTANPQDIYVLVVGNASSSIPPNPNSAEGCYDIVTLTLIVDPIPLDLGPFEMALCDDELQGSTPTDEISTFDLTSQNILVTGGDPTLTVVWYETPADEAADNPIPNPTTYQNFATPQTVIGRVTSEFGCSNTVTLTLTVLPVPNANPNPTPIVICDDDDDGIVSTFDLTSRDAEILNGETDVTIFYYESMQAAIDAVAGTELTSPYTNTVPYNQTVYARVTNQVPPEQLPCYTIVALALEVVALPDAPDATFQDPLFACDIDGNGTAIFDLTLQDAAVYGVQDPADFEPITYHQTQADADLGVNAINPADAFESSGQTIWVRLESIATGCARVTAFEIEMGNFPGSGTANDLVLCDDELNGSTRNDGISTFDLTENTPVITGGDPTLIVQYYASEADRNNDIPITNPAAYQNVVSPQQEIFVGIAGQNSCTAGLSFFITVNPNPEPVEPTPLVACDVDNNGYSSFDLESKTAEIQGGDPTLIVTYHENLLDANSGGFPLASPYENIVAFNQTLYVRVAYDSPPNGTGCYTVVTLELIVRESPIVPQDLPDLVACDDSGFAEFDLTQQEDLIYGSQSPADYTLTYHLNEADANTGLNFIVQPETFTNSSNPQTIWVRLDDNATECYAIGSFNLVVNSGLPITDPTPMEVCDDLGQENDGIATFDLTLKNAEITNGVLTQGVTYFLTEEDAQNNENRIDPDTAYVNVDAGGNPINPQVLYVRVEDSNSACVSFTTLTLRVISNPNPVTPEPIVLCDYNVIVPPGPYDEVELFDLTLREAQIRNGNNWTLDYYESYDDAVAQTAAIPAADVTAYQNLTNPQIVYVRATSPTTGCFEIVPLELIVEPLPDDSAVVEPYVYCSSDGTEIGIFDLTTKTAEILGGQPAPPMEVSFYLTALDAQNNTNAITNVTNYRNMDAGNNPINPQTIFTGITNSETGCYIGGVQSFELIVQPGAMAVTPAEPFVICDNLMPSDGFAEFNLDDLSDQQVSDLHAEILAGQDPADFSVAFYETLEGAETGVGAISFPYVNIINPQRIYVRVTNETNIYQPSCYAVVELILKVEQLPDVVLANEYRLCVDENGNPIAAEDGGASPPVIDTGLDPNLYTFVWDLDGVIIAGQTGPSIIALQGGVYTVTITELASGCESTATTTVVISSPPETYEADVTSDAFADSHTIEVTATGAGTYEYQLDDGPFQDSNIFENVTPGNHTVTIRDIYGCGSVTIEVGVIDYPLYFTPNGDGYHDTWNIIGIANGDPTAKIYIFDRFGKLLKQLSPLGEGWDGTFGGRPLPSSDYWFRVEYTEDDVVKQFKGHFTLKR